MQDRLKFRKLTPLEMRGLLATMPGWNIDSGRLEKEFRFKSFSHALIFVNKIVNPIEENQNYPRILITYDRVHISLFNNAVGAITVMDFDMAKEIDALSA